MGELGVRVGTHNVFSLAFPHGDIEVTDFSSILRVKARIGHVHGVM